MSDNYDGPQMAQKILRLQAEIERLRDQVVRLSTLVDTERSLHDAEIKRLRKDFTNLLRLAANDATEYQADIERLKLKVKEWSDLAIDHTTVIGQLHTDIDLLKSENKKLRNAAAKLFFDSEGDTQYFDNWLENFMQEGE